MASKPPVSALNRQKTTVIRWKGFEFPVSVRDVGLVEDTKVATYEYAGRNGAEHERVKNYAVINLSCLFTSDSGPQPAIFYVNKLRSLNDNKPGELHHNQFGTFQCIMKKLSISENADNSEVPFGAKEIYSSYEVSMEFWEHTDPTATTISSQLEFLFPAAELKPPSDLYDTKLKYRTWERLFLAIKAGKIEPGTDPIRNAEWLQYPFDQRTQAYTAWTTYLATLPTPTDPTTSRTITNQASREITAKPGDTHLTIAEDLGVPLYVLIQENTGKEVRSDGTKFEDTLFDCRAGDVLTCPAPSTLELTGGQSVAPNQSFVNQ